MATTTRHQSKMQPGQVAGTGNYNARFDELDSKLDKLLELNASTNTMLNNVVGRVDTLDAKTESIMADVHEQGLRLNSQEKRVSELEKKLQQANDYIDQLENRHRENNLRLLNAGEGEERNTPIPYLVKILAEKWNLELKEDDFEKAHRVGPLKDNAKRPRAIIFKLHHFQKKQLIWKQTRETPEGCDLKIVQDTSVQLRMKKAEYWPLREQLHLLDIKTYIKHPATLYVEDGETTMSFKSPDEAKREMKRKYPAINVQVE